MSNRAPDGYVVAIDRNMQRVHVADQPGGYPGPWQPYSAFVPVDPFYAPLTSLFAPVWRVSAMKVQASVGPCTCGVKFTGGLCSSWCDTMRPAESGPVTDRLNDWLPPGFKLPPGGVPFGRPFYMSQPAHAPTKAPQATPLANGSSAKDVLCACCGYIVRKGQSHLDAAGDAHSASVCMVGGNWIHSAAPKP